jgi:hypothetical protein
MTNIQGVYQTEVARSYERDGYQDAVNDLRRTAGRIQHYADDLTRTVVAPANGTATATVVSTRAAKLFMVEIDASGSAGFLQILNATSGIIGTQTNLAMVIPFDANATTTVRIFPGSATASWFATGIVCGTCTTATTSTAIGTAVNKVMFLTSTAP